MSAAFALFALVLGVVAVARTSGDDRPVTTNAIVAKAARHAGPSTAPLAVAAGASVLVAAFAAPRRVVPTTAFRPGGPGARPWVSRAPPVRAESPR